MGYTESFWELYHGTDEISAQQIRNNGFKISNSPDLWCGSGVYFYDLKAKAWWYAKNTCHNIKLNYGKKIKPAVVRADILEISKDEIFDLRVFNDIQDFRNFSSEFLNGNKLEIDGLSDEEKNIKLRSILISFYANKTRKKLIIGIFKQRERSEYNNIIEYASELNIVFGTETIYCVRDTSIISNIR